MPNAYGDITTLKSGAFLNYASTSDDTYLLFLLEASARAVDALVKRHFYCWEGSRYYNGSGQVLFLDDILSITTFKTDDDMDGIFENSWTADQDYQLFPLNEFPKYRAEISSRSDREYTNFNSGSIKGVEITGVFGFGDGLSATPYKTSGAVVNTGGIAANATSHALATGKGDLFAVGQTIRIGSEQIYITSISGDTLNFLSNPSRGQNGTTAATHTAGDIIYIYQYHEFARLGSLIQAMRWFKRKDTAFQDISGNPMTGQLNYYKKLDPDIAVMVMTIANPRYQ